MSSRIAPKTQLRLEWVYGYRGHQCRNNLFYINQSEIVYFVAGVAVVYNKVQHLQRFYFGHDDDIVSLAIHPNQTTIATGQIGKNPFICIWDAMEMKTLSLLKDQHTHGVASIAFSCSGEKLASVGLDSNSTLVIWDWKTGRPIASAKGHSDRVFDISWDIISEQKVVTCGVKHIKFWTLCGNSLTSKRGVFGRTGDLQTILCVCSSDDNITFSGTLNGDVYRWRENILERTIACAHTGGIFTMHKCADGYATGCRDGTIKLWDIEFNPLTSIDLRITPLGYEGLSVRSVCWASDRLLVGTQNSEIFEVLVRDKENPIPLTQGHAEGELWGLCVQNKSPIAATAGDDATVRLWNLVDHMMFACYNLEHSARSCAFSSDNSHLAVGCKNGSFVVIRIRDMSELLVTRDRIEVIHEMKYSPDGCYLAVASNDNFVDVYAVGQRYKRVGSCSKSSSFITHIDWSIDSSFLQTNDGAGERLIYSMPGGQLMTSADKVRNISWYTWTCILGTEVNGIWPKYTTINDVNSVDATFKRNLCATGDDFGLVKLFNFPSLKKGAKFRKYVGHSAHVTNVRFSSDSKWLLTTGGADHAVFQWTLIDDGIKTIPQHIDLTPQATHTDSCTDGSDSDYSDVAELDSDIEQESQMDYNRDLYRDDLNEIKRKTKQNYQPEVNRKRTNTPDNVSLKLQYVFGYRGYDCRDNLFYTQTDEIVYHVAALGVVFNPKKKTQRFYEKHNDDILCLSLHPHKDLAASGQVGKDAAIHIWDVNTLNTLSILKGFHERGVSSVDFSEDGKKLASIGLDDDHSLALWDWKKGQKLATSRGHKDKIFMIRFDPMDSNKLVSVGVKHIKFWQHVGGGISSNRGIFGNNGKSDTMLCVAYGQQNNVFSGGTNGQVFIWRDKVLERTVKTHDGPCFAIHALDKGFVTGGKDGVVCLWSSDFDRCLKSYPIVSSNLSNESVGKLVEDNPTVRAINLGNSKILIGTKNSEILEISKLGPVTLLVQGHADGELWGLACHPSKPECATISSDKTLRTWSISAGSRHMINVRKLPVGGKCCSYSPNGSALAVGRDDGSFIVVSCANLEDLVHYHHRKEAISDIKFSPGSGKYLAVASHDNFIDIYNVLSSKRVGICKGASSYITHIDWDVRGKLLCANSGAKELLYFEAPRGKRQTISSDEVINWHTWTGVLGQTCEGIWPAYSDVTDVNATCLNNQKNVIATGDDFGFVKLFTYPSKGKHAKFKKYSGHSAHVTNVRWSHDSSMLLSVGGADTSVMIWSCSGIEVANSTGINSKFTYHGDSEDSDTDSEEEGGYDSDVAREKNIDYSCKTYNPNIRSSEGLKPNVKDVIKPDKPPVSRSLPQNDRVKKKINLSLSHVTDLELDHVFGYRGFDCRDNVFYLSDASKVVYHAAGAGIVHDITSGEQQFYLEHTDDIISLAVNQHPKFTNIVATGQLGNNPSIHVWNALTRKTLSIMKGFHTVGICYLNFSSSGKLLLSVGVDDKHSIAIWRWQEGIKVSNHSSTMKRIFCAQFRPDSDSHFVSVGVKHVMFWQVCGSALLSKRGVLGATEGIKAQTMLSVAFGANDLTFTGAMSGDVYVWKGHILTRTVAKAHAGPVFSLFTTLRDGLIVSGGKEKTTKEGGAVKLWDQEMRRCRAFHIDSYIIKSVSRHKGKILVGTRDSEVKEISEKNGASATVVSGHSEGELWGLSCHPTSLMCCTTSDDKTARIWDLNDKIMSRRIPLTSGSRACTFSNDGNKIAIGLNSGEVILVDVVAVKVLSKKRDRSAAVHDLRFRPDDKMLAVASAHNTVDLYDVKEDGKIHRVGYCKQLRGFGFQLDFSTDGNYLQVGTSEYKRLIFKVPEGLLISDNKVIEDITWHTWTSVLGDDVIGVWPKNCENGDVNSSHVNNAGNAVVTGDDFGFVKLFNFPCREKFSKSRKFIGHSAHVTTVRFVYDDSRLVTTGGDDCCVFVWRCK